MSTLFPKALFLSFISLSLFLTSTAPAQAQVACNFIPVSQPLTDLGPNPYYRLTSTNPPTYVATTATGGLYPGGSNQRPAQHEADGLNLAHQITPLDANGLPSPNGKIGMASVGMSNTQMEFGPFKVAADTDPQVNDYLKIANGAAGGGVIEAWVDPNHPQYSFYWSNFDSKIAAQGMNLNQVQVVWVKITQLEYQPVFPDNMLALTDQYTTLTQLLHQRLPNLKIIYFSSRTRSFIYQQGLAPETSAFENGFAVKWLIERQLNGDPSLNYKPENGPVNSAYITWGPYLWIDGLNPRSDGRVWPLEMVNSRDCTHPTTLGQNYVKDMMMAFFKTDATATPWFLNANTPTPTPFPTPTTGPTPTPTPIPSPTPTLIPTPTPTPSPSPTPMPPGSPVSAWSFAQDQVADDLNPCIDCVNYSASWFSLSPTDGAYAFDGSQSYLNLGTFPYLNQQPSLSVSVWIKPDFDQTHSSWRYVFSDGSNIALYYLAQIQDWRFSIRTTRQYSVDTLGLNWNPGDWHHLAGTYDGSSLKIYWDGQLQASKPALGPIAADSGSTYLGASAIKSDKFLGAIDELKIFQTTLTDSQILSLTQNR